MVEHAFQILGQGLEPWGYLVVFLTAALESSAFVGLAVPGETVLLLAGVLGARGDLALGPAMALGAFGAVLGDSAGYEIGRHLGPRLERSWVGRKVGPARWERARAQVRRRGPQAVLVGRFVGLLRPLVPVVAGDARMPYRSFLLWNVLGALVWAPATVALGYLAGESYQAVAHSIGWAALALVGGLAGVAVTVRLIRSRRAATARNGEGARGAELGRHASA